MSNQDTNQTINTSIFTLKEFANQQSLYSLSGLRNLIFDERNNGLHELGVLIRVGRKIFVDKARFYAWIESKRGVAK